MMKLIVILLSALTTSETPESNTIEFPLIQITKEVDAEGNARFYDRTAGSEWSKIEAEAKEKCVLASGMLDQKCKREIISAKRDIGSLRGKGYCDNNYTILSETDRISALKDLTVILSEVRALSLGQRIDRAEGEIFYGDVNVEIRCLNTLVNRVD